jgi:hypothetical protein
MKPVVFLGPTLPVRAAARGLDADYRPPAARGDVHRAVRDGARVIGIVDGYFRQTPAVLHKEILWAMAEGAQVLGAASMGALRAAELDGFGMTGVGWVYHAFRDGRLTGDDEVAVAHGPAAAGYPAISEAMVNIRRTLAAAARAGVIEPDTRARLAAAAKALYYPDRSWDRLLDPACGHGVAGEALAALGAWLPEGRVDRKRADALGLLEHIAAGAAAGAGPRRVAYAFEHTVFWQDVLDRAAADRPPDPEPPA